VINYIAGKGISDLSLNASSTGEGFFSFRLHYQKTLWLTKAFFCLQKYAYKKKKVTFVY